MTPLFIKLNDNLPLMIIPDTQAHLDGHTILTFTYSIFRDVGAGNPLTARSKESTLHLEKIDDPNYYGYITFEQPGRLFTYTADGRLHLNSAEVRDIIALLTEIRDNPAGWKQLDEG
jgi:hypothetical protein